MKRRTDNSAAILRDGAAIDRAIVAAHRRIILQHRQQNRPLVIWRDGQVVEVAPDSVELPEYDPEPRTDALTEE